MTDAGLKELAARQGLSALKLESAQVTDAGLKELVALNRLPERSAWPGRKITDAGLREIGLAPDPHVSRFEPHEGGSRSLSSTDSSMTAIFSSARLLAFSKAAASSSEGFAAKSRAVIRIWLMASLKL